MPHIILEYSGNLSDRIDIGQMIENLHDALSEKGVDRARIKTRATKLENYVVGAARNREGAMMHATLLLLEGRDDETKISYGGALHAIMKDRTKDVPGCAVTLEVRDMKKETYFL